MSATYDAQDRLLTYGGNSYTYNDHGQLVTKTYPVGVESYEYDELGNLLSVTLPDSTLIEYTVDALGRRVAKKVNGTLVRQWTYQDGLNPVAEYDGSGNLIQQFVYATRMNVPDLIIRGGTTYRVIADQVGSVRRIVEVSTGAIVQEIAYSPFGKVLSDSSPGWQPFAFAGGLYDQQTKLVRFGARDYDAETGRWTAKDPIGFDGGNANIFAYVAGDPVNNIDPEGLIIRGAFKVAEKLLRGGSLRRFSDGFGQMSRGDGIIASKSSEAEEFARAYSKAKGGKGKVVHDTGHVLSDGSTGKPHFHALDRHGNRLPGHAWYDKIGAFFLSVFDTDGSGKIERGEAWEISCPLPWGCGLDKPAERNSCEVWI